MVEDTPQELDPRPDHEGGLRRPSARPPGARLRRRDLHDLAPLARRLPPPPLPAGQRRRGGRRKRRPRPAGRARRAACARRPARRPRASRPRGRRFVAPPTPSPRLPARRTPSSTTSASARPGIARSDRRRFTASILDSVLGGSASSRLFQEIREKRGLAYCVYTFASQYADTGQIGHLRGHAGGEPRRVPADRRRADRRDRRRTARGRTSSSGPRRTSRAGSCSRWSDLEPDEPARQVAHHRQRAPRPRPHPRGDRGGGRRTPSPQLAGVLLARERLSVAAIGPSEERFLDAVERICPGLVGARRPREGSPLRSAAARSARCSAPRSPRRATR